ncbi:hypothetical protein ACR77J_06015 [Tissierella praeacuta]|uniref:hypothetical protein n=1 Tax=Tissierella praeacuta TaxID=43131 RepID=UPI00104AF9FC|nr:hypothetical protein [Tissierella praeacuta]TCU75601.1 hypothetical protein EV204_103156 [Tissierella praeacuta]
MFNEIMSADGLKTFVGLTTAVTVIVQFTKPIVKNTFGDSMVRLYAFFVSLILTLIFARDTNGIQGIVLSIINAMMITVASMGGYEAISDPMAQKSKK